MFGSFKNYELFSLQRRWQVEFELASSRNILVSILMDHSVGSELMELMKVKRRCKDENLKYVHVDSVKIF